MLKHTQSQIVGSTKVDQKLAVTASDSVTVQCKHSRTKSNHTEAFAEVSVSSSF